MPSTISNVDVTDNGVESVVGAIKQDGPDQILIHTDEGSSWPKISDEFDAKMLEHSKQPLDLYSDKVKMSRIGDDGECVSVPAASRNFVSFGDLRDMENRPIAWQKRYYIHAGNENYDRMLDYEDGNKRRVVFNSKWNDGLHMLFDNHMLDGGKSSSKVIGLRYPGGTDWRGSDWLLGMLSGTNDVVLGKNQLSSEWLFEYAGTDNRGHPHYRIFTELSGATEVGGIWFPTNGIAQAGYDKDYEWRTYETGNARYGFFTVKFRRLNYNE